MQRVIPLSTYLSMFNGEVFHFGIRNFLALSIHAFPQRRPDRQARPGGSPTNVIEERFKTRVLDTQPSSGSYS